MQAAGASLGLGGTARSRHNLPPAQRHAAAPTAGRRRPQLTTVRAAAGGGGQQQQNEAGGLLGLAVRLLQRFLGAGDDTAATTSSSTTTSTPSKAAAPAAAAAAPAPAEEKKSDEYTEEMQAKMGTSLTYRHEDGINWNAVLPDLVVGSCLQGPEDADRLAAAGVTTVFSLQEDCDMEYFNIDVAAIQARCKEVGIKHVRFPVRDFDPYDLRRKLPKAVAALAKAHKPDEGIAYIHCTAGLGRAPATALAYMFWLRGWHLPDALRALTLVRACSPRIEAIRAATADLLTDSRPVQLTIGLRRRGTAQRVQVAGLDVGWHTLLDLVPNPATQRLEVTREVLPGAYPFKFILDGTWCASHDYPTYQDGANVNNILTVLPRDAHDNAVRERLLSATGALLEDERRTLAASLCPWATHTPTLHLPGTSAGDARQA